jgi:hypothetical protein
MTGWDNHEYTQFIKPPGAFPEGYDVAEYLQRLLYRFGILPPEDAHSEVILDMFCGKGRLAPCIPLRHVRVYRGVDINADAIGQARLSYPEYKFDILDATTRKWKAKCIILWTAISMLDDASVLPFLMTLEAQHIIIGEICGRNWRNIYTFNHPPIYNREWYEYPDLMNAAGYDLQHHEQQPHVHYSGDLNWQDRDTNMHTFIFHRDNQWQFYKEARIR